MKKKIIVFLSLSILVLSSYCLITNKTNAVDEISQENIKKIEEEEKKCIDENNQTNAGMINCTDVTSQKYEKEIEKVLKASKKMLTKEEYEQLLKTQEKWEEFIREEYALIDMIYEKPNSPRTHYFIAMGVKDAHIEQRAKKLVSFYLTYNLTKDDLLPN